MPKSKFVALLILAMTVGATDTSLATPITVEQEPQTYLYREIEGQKLKAYVFRPQGKGNGEKTAAILLFHGGGWHVGSPEWTFNAARRFAALGLVAISVEYRLSKGKVTPIEALADTCAAFRWARQQTDIFNIDPSRVAGYGVSAGGHLVAASATVSTGDETDTARPDVLLLWSPALDMESDGWFRKLLGDRGSFLDYSPVEHAGASTPPTSIVIGDKDTLTPLSGAKRYRDRVIQAGGICELNVYPGVGHLLTRNLANQERDFDPDPEASADGIAQQERFLRDRGFIH